MHLKIGKVASNAIWIIGCKIIKSVLTLLVTMLTARYLGPANYGLINYAAGIVTFVTPIMKLGFDAILVHEVVNDEKNEGKIIGTSIILNIVSAIFCIVGVVSFATIVNSGEKDTIIVCGLYSTLLVFQAIEMIQYWFQAKLLSKYSSIAMLFSYVFITGFQILLLINHMGVYWFAISNSIDYCIIAIILLMVYSKKSKYKLSFSLKIGKKLLHNGRYYIIASMMVVIFQQTDRIMLKIMINNEAVGYYSAAATCASMISFVFVAIIDSVRPTVFQNKNISVTRYENSLSSLYSIIIYSSLLTSLLMTIFSSIIIRILYGSDYSSSVSALRIICWFTTFSYLGTIRNIWIVAEKKQQYLWVINMLGALMNIILNLLLIPKYEIIGASTASLLTQFFTNVSVNYG